MQRIDTINLIKEEKKRLKGENKKLNFSPF